jgi:serine/threonine protein kinase
MKRGPIKVDAGRQGAVFLASTWTNGSRPFIIKVVPHDNSRKGKKQIAEIEYEILEKLHKVVPDHIPHPMGFFRCLNFVPESTWPSNSKDPKMDYSKQNIECMEYISNGTFGSFLDKIAASPRKRLSDEAMRSFIGQILTVLKKIHSVYPNFRHADLHLDNILVSPRWEVNYSLARYKSAAPFLYLTDFGWSRMTKSSENSASNNKNFYEKRYGIGSDMDIMYDSHLALSQLRTWCIHHADSAKDRFVETIKFLNKYIPAGYRTENDTYTSEFRLKYGTKFPFSFDDLLGDEFLSPKKKVSPPRVVAKAPSPRRNLTNNNLLKVSPRGFLKLTPGQRRRLINLKKKSPKKSPSRLVIPKAKLKTPSPVKQRTPSPQVRVSPKFLRGAKFNKLVTSFLNYKPVYTILPKSGRMKSPSPSQYYAALNIARNKATKYIKSKVKAGQAPYTPSPPRAPANRPHSTAYYSFNVVKTPKTGRIKITGPSGRLVYAEGLKLEALQAIARRRGIAFSGMTKAEIAQALFSRK